VAGAFERIEDIESLKIIDGRSINALDMKDRRKVVLIGKRVRDQLFVKGEPVLGENITINGINFQVVGVSESLQQGNQQQEDEKVYIPNDTLRYAFNQTGFVGSLMLIPKPGIHAKVAEEDVKRYLAQRKKISPDDKGVFGSFNLQDESDKVDGLFIGIKAFSWIIAIGTIFAGAVGVGNIMLIVVKERTREIGLRKAVGARPAAILLQFLVEAIMLCFFGGIVGLLVGQGLTSIVRGIPAAHLEKAHIPAWAVALSFGFAAAVGLIFGMFPAIKAARLDPIEALRHE
jgi:putative ABC transport system permease protein